MSYSHIASTFKCLEKQKPSRQMTMPTEVFILDAAWLIWGIPRKQVNHYLLLCVWLYISRYWLVGQQGHCRRHSAVGHKGEVKTEEGNKALCCPSEAGIFFYYLWISDCKPFSLRTPEFARAIPGWPLTLDGAASLTSVMLSAPWTEPCSQLACGVCDAFQPASVTRWLNEHRCVRASYTSMHFLLSVASNLTRA